MSRVTRLKAQFGMNWATALVGWKGLGRFSPWPDRWKEFPSLITSGQVEEHALERLEHSSDPQEVAIITTLLVAISSSETRERIEELLANLAGICQHNHSLEMRKWRAVLLEELLENIPDKPVYGLIALSEFWQGFGFPSDSPHEAQGKGSPSSPGEYYTKENFERLLKQNREWLGKESASIKEQQKLEKCGLPGGD